MSDAQGSPCVRVRESIPDFVAGRLAPDRRPAVLQHMETCVDCRAEVEVVRMVLAARPTVPAGLADRVIKRVAGLAEVRSGGGSRPWWGVAAAALAALALGIGVTSAHQNSEVEVPAYMAGVEDAQFWFDDDGVIAGAPALADLSDAALLTLLDDMTTDGTGGAA